MGSDPFLEPEAGSTDGKRSTKDDGETQGERSASTEERAGPGRGDEDYDEDEDEEDDDDETDDSELWEPSRSVRKSLSVSED